MLSLLFIHASRTKRKRIKRKVLPQSLPSPSSSSSLPFSSSSLPFSSSSLPFSSSSRPFCPFSSSSRPLHLLPSFSSTFSPIAMQRRSAPASLPPPADVQRRQHSQQQTITVVENSRHRQNDDHSLTETSAQMSKSKSSRWSDIFGGWTGNGREGRKGSDGNSAEELIAAVQTLHSSSKMAAKSAEAQLKGAAILTKWAGKSNNEAMADVVARVGELMEMHAERQRTFAKDYGHYLRQLHKVAETERKMRAQCRRVEKLADEERRLGKMLVKKGGGDELSAQLERVKREREWAEREVEEERHEAEFARMAHLAAGLEGLADVQLNLARAGQLIFACQRELAAFVCKERPTEREGPTRQRHRYGGVPQTRQKMAELRRSLEAGEMEMAYNAPSSVERRQRQRRSEPCSLANDRHGDRFRPNQQRQPISHPLGTPPPPYTPSAPPLELLDSVTRPSNTNRHSVGPSFFSDGINNGPPVARIYPQLPPNPFAEELKQRRRCRGPISVE